MNILKVVLNALPEKRRELEQAVLGMLPGIRESGGCRQCRIARDLELISCLTVVSRWEERKNLDAFLKSDRFAVLMGTRILLKAPPRVYLEEVVTSEGTEDVGRIRLEKRNH